MAINRCKSCGNPIPYDRVYCCVSCVGDAFLHQLTSPNERKEYMVQYYLRELEITWVEKIL